MKSQRGGALAIVLSILAIIAVLVVVVISIFVSANNRAVALENGLDAAYQNNQNILTTYYQKVQEAAQIPGMMSEAQRKVIRDSLEGRYGKDGSRAVFQSIQEQNPTVSEALYIKVQTIVEAGRDEYKNGQSMMIDKARVYTTVLDTIPGGFVMRMMGFPRKDMNKYKPVITDSVDQVYQRGRESGPLQIAPAAK